LQGLLCEWPGRACFDPDFKSRSVALNVLLRRRQEYAAGLINKRVLFSVFFNTDQEKGEARQGFLFVVLDDPGK